MRQLIAGPVAVLFCVWWIGFVASATIVLTEPTVVRVLGLLVALPVVALLFKGTFWLLETANLD
jgi:hypothetical protein